MAHRVTLIPGDGIGPELAEATRRVLDAGEPVHGSAPKCAGMNKANPTAPILSGALMLRHLGHPEAAPGVENAVRDVIAEGQATTYDLGGSAGTSEFADAIIHRLAAGSSTAAAPATTA